jgi:very-short-patch-repair endonuclease
MDRRDLMYLARDLRQRATWAEARAWEVLRGRRCLGFKVRRQFSYRGFVLDFYCRELALDLEVDGDVHDDSECRSRDEARDEILTGCGLRVVRLRNEEVCRERLEEILKDVPPLHVCGEGDRG